jgi:uncharacterized membrane protein YkoI
MNRKKLVVSTAAMAALTLGAGIAYATSNAPDATIDDSGEHATGPDIEKAKSIALDHTNGGRVTGTEIRDDEGFYEVEVTRDDGSQVDIHLDRSFHVLSTLADYDSSNDEAGSNEK